MVYTHNWTSSQDDTLCLIGIFFPLLSAEQHIIFRLLWIISVRYSYHTVGPGRINERAYRCKNVDWHWHVKSHNSHNLFCSETTCAQSVITEKTNASILGCLTNVLVCRRTLPKVTATLTQQNKLLKLNTVLNVLPMI